jgi:hypothetical protein
MSVLCGLSAAQAVEASSGPDTIEPPQLHATAPNASLVTSVSPPLLDKAESLQRRVAPDCDSVTPSTASVTALLSRFVRSSTPARGVQCPIPPVPEHLTIQEVHP